MVVGVCRLSLFFAENRSLKGKRQGLRRIVDRVRAKFNAGVAEVGQHDDWKRAQIGVAVVSNNSEHAQSMIDNITSFVDQLFVAQILDREVELLNYGEGEPMGEEPSASDAAGEAIDETSFERGEP